MKIIGGFDGEHREVEAMTGRRFVAHSRRGTLVLEPDRPLTAQHMDTLIRQVRKALAGDARVLVLDGSVHVTGIIPAAPRPGRRRGYRPRWAR